MYYWKEGTDMSPRILIVDDEPLYIQLLQVNLKAEGYDVISAGVGNDAIE